MDLLDIVRERPIAEKATDPVRCPFRGCPGEFEPIVTEERAGHITKTCRCDRCGVFTRHETRDNVWYAAEMDRRPVVQLGIPSCCGGRFIYHCAKCNGPVSAQTHEAKRDVPIEAEKNEDGIEIAIVTATIHEDGTVTKNYRVRYACEACGHGGYTTEDHWFPPRPPRPPGAIPRKLAVTWSPEMPVRHIIGEDVVKELADAMEKEVGEGSFGKGRMLRSSIVGGALRVPVGKPIIQSGSSDLLTPPDPKLIEDLELRSVELVPSEKLVDPNTRIRVMEPEGPPYARRLTQRPIDLPDNPVIHPPEERPGPVKLFLAGMKGPDFIGPYLEAERDKDKLDDAVRMYLMQVGFSHDELVKLTRDERARLASEHTKIKIARLENPVEPPTDQDRKDMADAGGIAERDLPFGAAEASRDIRLREEEKDLAYHRASLAAALKVPPTPNRIDQALEAVTPSATRCGRYMGDNDGTSPQLSCVREKGHFGLCDNVSEQPDTGDDFRRHVQRTLRKLYLPVTPEALEIVRKAVCEIPGVLDATVVMVDDLTMEVTTQVRGVSPSLVKVADIKVVPPIPPNVDEAFEKLAAEVAVLPEHLNPKGRS